MAWERFTKKETREKSTWNKPQTEFMDRISCSTDGDWYFEIEGTKHILPIQDICRVTPSQEEEEEYLINNREIGIFFKKTGKIRRFFRIPSVIPETLTYYSDGLVGGISKTKDEVISFKVGGQFADSEFSITNYTVAVRLDDCTDIYADSKYLYVLYGEGVCVLAPEEI